MDKEPSAGGSRYFHRPHVQIGDGHTINNHHCVEWASLASMFLQLNATYGEDQIGLSVSSIYHHMEYSHSIHAHGEGLTSPLQLHSTAIYGEDLRGLSVSSAKQRFPTGCRKLKQKSRARSDARLCPGASLLPCCRQSARGTHLQTSA